MKNIFFSYSNKDSEAANKIVEGIKISGHHVWFAPDKILGGENYAKNIDEGIEQCDIFVLLASKNSVGNKSLKVEPSSHVCKEIQLALDEGKVIIPLNLDDRTKAESTGKAKYLLSDIQYIEISVALAAGDLTPVVEEIISSADKISIKSQDEEYIEKAEIALVLGHFEQSSRLLGKHSYNKKNIPRVDFIKALSNLMRKGINNLSISDANELTSEFERLRHTNMASSSVYMLAILKVYCYQEKGFKNSIDAISTLKSSVKGDKHIDIKYRFVADGLLPIKSQFTVDWLI